MGRGKERGVGKVGKIRDWGDRDIQREGGKEREIQEINWRERKGERDR